MKYQEWVPHLFRTEFARITAVLCNRFGIDQIETAEDLASDTFVAALESWTYQGIPENPRAWLYAVAKNKAKNYIKRHHLFLQKIAPQLQGSDEWSDDTDFDWSAENIMDSQLQMLFALCHPSIPVQSQVALSLRILCGFGIEEIANAFLTNKETINKRLLRAKEKLKSEKVSLKFPGVESINGRLGTVMITLYLLFNEGYSSESVDGVLREDLCHEAMRLTYLLIENDRCSRPVVHALYALMCFQASRFPARKNDQGEMILYDDQDHSLWDHSLICKGIFHLHRSASGDDLSKYHLEASIAYWHTIKEDSFLKWSNILNLYDQLLNIDHSPVVALNRIYALYKLKGSQAALEEAEKLSMTKNHFYFVLLAELNHEAAPLIAKQYLLKAYNLAKTQTDKIQIEKKLSRLTNSIAVGAQHDH